MCSVINLNLVDNLRNWAKQKNNIYIGRATRDLQGSKWANPYIIGDRYDRKTVIFLYEKYILGRKKLYKSLLELEGKTLGCWCTPKACHGEVLQRHREKMSQTKMASEEAATNQYQLMNLGTNVTVEDILNFLGFTNTESERKACSVAISVKAGENFAFVMVPQKMGARVEDRNGTNLHGRMVKIQRMNGKEMSTPPITENKSTENMGTDVGIQSGMATTESTRSYSAATGSSSNSDRIHEYVEIDTSYYHDCRHMPTNASVYLAIQNTFGEDEDRRTKPPAYEEKGIYRLEVSDINRYKGVEDLELLGQKIARVTVRSEKIVVTDEGRIKRFQQHDPNDLFIKLPNADCYPLNRISDDDIIEAIMAMNIGRIKRAPQRLLDRQKMEFTGDKFFVLKNVSTEDRQRVPTEFSFNDPTFGKLVMRVNHRFRIRFCSYCGNRHEAVCPVREKVERLRAEKEEMIKDKIMSLKVMGDSTIRYLNSTAVQGDVEAMSGGTTGNLLNALEVDDDVDKKETIVLVSGANEKNANYSPSEYIYALKKIRERVSHLLNTSGKKVALLPPPKPVEYRNPVEEVKEEIFNEHLLQMEKDGVKVWENPIEGYEEDFGRHPSPEQSLALGKYIQQKLATDFNLPLFMKSATEDVIALRNKYWHVTTFYKFGCGACASRAKNKWYNICNLCKEAAQKDEEVQKKAQWFAERVNEIMPLPQHSEDEHSEDELKCDDCNVFFTELSDIRRHFTESHPDADFKFKRAKFSTNNHNDDGKRGRREKKVPIKSL